VTIHNSDPAHALVVNSVKLASSLDLVEDFDSGTADGWLPSNPAQWQVVGGEYRALGIGNMQSFYTEGMWSDLSVRVKLRREGSASTAHGLAVRASDDFNWSTNAGRAYATVFSGNGNFWVGKFTGSGFAFLQGWTPSSFLNTGSGVTNEVPVCGGGGIRFGSITTGIWPGRARIVRFRNRASWS
jgi:hypothetical protein